MPKQWMYNTPNPGGELTKKDKIILLLVGLATGSGLVLIGWMLWSIVN